MAGQVLGMPTDTFYGLAADPFNLRAVEHIYDVPLMFHQEGLDEIHVKIADSIYDETDKQVDQMTRIHGNIGCPLTSALACAIAKSTGNPTIIADEKTSDDGRTKEVYYYTYEEE
jgi:spore maturation protein SpmB